MATTTYDPATTVILGGQLDPEMRRVQELVTQHGFTFIPAKSGGQLVNPRSAYEADTPDLPAGTQTLVLVECRPRVVPEGIQTLKVDHHFKGDPGANMRDEDYFQASSLGQIYTHLLPNLTPPHEDFVLSAMDVNYAKARAGLYTGVTGEEVGNRKVAEIAAQLKRMNNLPEDLSVLEHWVRKTIYSWSAVLQSAPVINLGNFLVADLRQHYLGEGYSLDYLAAQDAVVAAGKAALLFTRDARKNPEVQEPDKWVLCGHAAPELIRYFMTVAAKSEEFTGIPGGIKDDDIYGMEDRGYAGLYLR